MPHFSSVCLAALLFTLLLFFGLSPGIVLGDIEHAAEFDNDAQDFVSVASGVFYFSGCPWPPADGQLFPFRLESVPRKPAGD